MRYRGRASSPIEIIAALSLACLCISACSDTEAEGSSSQQTSVSETHAEPDYAPPAEPASVTIEASRSTSDEVPLEDEGGTFLIPVTINDAIELKFTIDSGASDVTIPSDVASTLVRAGTIAPSDYVGSKTFILADGSEVPSPEFRIRSLKVGKVVLHNVIASITGTSGSLLLGQSFLEKLKAWSIDNSRHVLLLRADRADPEQTEAAVAGDPNFAAPPPNLAGAESGGPSSLQTTAENTVKQYFAAWSNGSDPDGQEVRRFYGDKVSFFGKTIQVQELMNGEKLRFAKRWPSRSYIVQTPTMRSRCSLSTKACTVTGIVDWSVSSAERAKHSEGTARFSLLIMNGRIIGEASRVLSRG